MNTGRNRIYADTSVYGGTFDAEFERNSKAFFEQVASGRFHLLISPIVRDEVLKAPPAVRSLIEDIGTYADFVPISESALRLQQAYLTAGIVGPKWEADALHVAVVTVENCWAIVSWNFRHIVHFDKIALYNEVNTANGYSGIGIYSPSEVISYGDD